MEPFDPRSGNLFRSLLLKTGDQEHILHLAVHHSITDAWSQSIIEEDIFSDYQAIITRSKRQGPEMQYEDFVRWERERFSGSALQARLASWERVLHEAPRELPLDWDDPTEKSDPIRFVLPPNDFRVLEAAARANKVTTFMMLSCLVRLLIAGLSGQRDIVLHSHSANREMAGSSRLVGLFSNQFIMRSLIEEVSFSGLLQSEKEGAILSLSNSVPFAHLYEHLLINGEILPRSEVSIILYVRSAKRHGVDGLDVQRARSPKKKAMSAPGQERLGFRFYKAGDLCSGELHHGRGVGEERARSIVKAFLNLVQVCLDSPRYSPEKIFEASGIYPGGMKAWIPSDESDPRGRESAVEMNWPQKENLDALIGDPDGFEPQSDADLERKPHTGKTAFLKNVWVSSLERKNIQGGNFFQLGGNLELALKVLRAINTAGFEADFGDLIGAANFDEFCDRVCSRVQ